MKKSRSDDGLESGMTPQRSGTERTPLILKDSRFKKHASNISLNVEASPRTSIEDDLRPNQEESDSTKDFAKMSIFRQYYHVIRHNVPYRVLWFGSIVSLTGDVINEIAILAVLDRLTSAGSYAAHKNILLSLLLVTREIPPFLFGPIVGVVADKFDKRKIMLMADLLRIYVVLGYLTVSRPDLLWVIFALSFLQFTVSSFFTPAKSGFIPEVVSDEELLVANSAEGVTWSALLFLGAAAGGFITHYLGTTANFIIDSFTYGISATFVIYLLGLPIRERTEEEKRDAEVAELEQTEAKSVLESIQNALAMFRSGLAFIWYDPYLRVLVLAKAASATTWGGLDVVNIRYAQDIYTTPGQDASLTISMTYGCIGLSTGLGPILFQYIFPDTPKNNHRALIVEFLVMLIGLIALIWEPNFAWFLGANFFRGLGSGAIWVYSGALLMKSVKPRFRGRVFAFEYAMYTFFNMGAKFLTGLLLDYLNFTLENCIQLFAVFCVVWIIIYMITLRGRYWKDSVSEKVINDDSVSLSASLRFPSEQDLQSLFTPISLNTSSELPLDAIDSEFGKTNIPRKFR